MDGAALKDKRSVRGQGHSPDLTLMRALTSWLFSSLIAWFGFTTSTGAQSSVTAKTEHLARDTYRPSDLAFMQPLLRNRSVVEVRAQGVPSNTRATVQARLVRFLHEEHGADLVMTEGSAIASWLEMERSFGASAGGGGIVGYIVASRATAHPLYLASFDVGIGQSEHESSSLIDGLFDVLSGYASRPRGAERWRTALLEMARCGPGFDAHMIRGVAEGVADWIDRASDAVAARRPGSHLEQLRALPMTMEQAAEVCARGATRPAHDRMRDSIAAANVVLVRDSVSLSHRVIILAGATRSIDGYLEFLAPKALEVIVADSINVRIERRQRPDR